MGGCIVIADMDMPLMFNYSARLTSAICDYTQLYARRHFLFPPLSIEEYNDRVTAVVRCEAQV